MKLIVGLGNPGKEYEKTRHNAGYMFLDMFSYLRETISLDNGLLFRFEKKFESEITEATIKGKKIFLAKPTTFMNHSGKAVSSILNFYKIEPKNLIVVSDDLDLPLGIIRVRKEGGSGGHKGVQNIIDLIGSEDFIRVRVGISEQGNKVTKEETSNYVLEKISKREEPIFDKVLNQAVSYIVKHLLKNEEIPCRTINVIAKEQGIER